MPARRVTLPKFNPAIEPLIIEAADGKEYTFIADINAMFAISEIQAELGIGDGQVPPPEAVYRILQVGFRREHGELELDAIRDLIGGPAGFMMVADAVVNYMNDVAGDLPQDGADGQGEAPRSRKRGKNSGRGRGTTSASRRRS